MAILVDRDLPLCPRELGYRPAPAGDPEAASSHFRYVEGRIYELGACDLPLERRGELRVYRYDGQGRRDDASRSSSERNARPDVMWTYGDRFLIEEWIFATPESNPGFAELANTVHKTISGLRPTGGPHRRG